MLIRSPESIQVEAFFRKQYGSSLENAPNGWSKHFYALIDLLIEVDRKAHVECAKAICGRCEINTPLQEYNGRIMHVVRRDQDGKAVGFSTCNAISIWDKIGNFSPSPKPGQA